MRPKNNTSVEDILKLVNNKVLVKNRTKYNTYVLETEDWDKLLGYSNLIYESGLVEYCHPNFIAPREKFQINDPKYNEQYYLNNTGQFGGTFGIDINAPEAWNITTGNCLITVAVIDDGAENHEDLNGRVLEGFTPQFSQENPDTHGGPNQNDPPGSHFGHGQCCAGIIGATHDSLGIRGIAPEVNMIPINIFNDWFTYLGQVYYSEDATDIAAAIDFAWNEAEADVLSNSWGYRTTDPDNIPDADAISDAIGRARTQGRNGYGSIVVFASGNSNQSFPGVTFPANVNGVITVGGINKNGNIWNYSSRGPEMELVAPSGALDLNGDVRTIDREGTNGYANGNYTDLFGGTSAACPQVAGVAALMLSARPDLTETQVRTILQQTATDMGPSGFDNTYGYGRVNAHAAVQAVYPYITGASLVCSSGAVFTLNNLPAVDSIRWIAGPYMSITTGQGTSTCTFTATGGGSSWVQARLYTSCDSIIVPQKTVWAGLPSQPTDIFGFGHDGMEFGSESIYRFTANHSTNQSVDQYNWVVGGGTIEDGQGTRQITVLTDQAGDQPLYFDVSVRVGNTCGWSPYLWRSGYVVEGDGQNDFVIYPNPATAEVMISVSDDRAASGAKDNNDDVFIKAVRILDSNGTLRRIESYGGGARSVTIDVSDLQKGIYLIKINEGEGEEIHRFIKR